MSNHAPYPGSKPEKEPDRKGRNLGILLILMGVGGCCGFTPALMAEGPHGPGGKITGDPGVYRAFPFVLLGAFVLLVLGTVLIRRNRG